MKKLRNQVRRKDVHHWVQTFLRAAEEAGEKEN